MSRSRLDEIALTARPAAADAADAAVARLEGLGLSRNEALAYLTLLEEEGELGMTGYEVAARSGIPRSAVYTVLRKLQGVGAAFEYGEDPVRFVATDPETWLAELRRASDARMEEAAADLRRLPKRARPEPVWILRRYVEVLQRADRMIRGATSSVWISAWARELAVLQPAFDAVADRTLHRVLHSPAGVAQPPAGFSAWLDRVDGDVAKAAWSHKLLLVVDRREALIGGAEPEADNHAVWTTNPSLVDMATNHVILDITLMARERDQDCDAVVSPMMRPHLLPLFLSGQYPAAPAATPGA
jgi:hypothetical protein